MANNKMKMIVSGLMFSAISTISNAAEIDVLSQPDLSVVFVNGEIAQGDAVRLRNKIRDNDRYADKPVSIVLLDSFGGSVSEGIKIGELIEEKRLMTVVAPDHSCYSSCVLIFLSGNPRYASPKSNLGVHRISENSADTSTARGLSIDLAQVYKEAKVPDSIRLAMLETPPNEMYTLSASEKKSLSTIDLDHIFKQSPSSQKSHENKNFGKSSKYVRYDNIAALIKNVQVIYENEHDPNTLLNDIKYGYYPDVFRIVKNNLTPSLRQSIDKYSSLSQKQYDQIVVLLDNAGISDPYIRTKIELDFWYYRMFDLAQMDALTDWENNHYLCTKNSCSDQTIDMIGLSFADHYNQLRELCQAGYCNEKMVKDQEVTWISMTEIGKKILKEVHPAKVSTNVPFIVAHQMVNINNMKFYISSSLKRTSYFGEFDYSSTSGLFKSVLGLFLKIDKLTPHQIAQYNAVMGSYVLPHLTYLIQQESGFEWADKLDVAASAYDLVYREFFVESNKAFYGPNYDKQKTEIEKLSGKIYRAITFLLPMLPERELSQLHGFIKTCTGSYCTDEHVRNQQDILANVIPALDNLCRRGNCSSKQLARQKKHMNHYQQTYYELLSRIRHDNSYTDLLKIMFLDYIIVRYFSALKEYGGEAAN